MEETKKTVGQPTKYHNEMPKLLLEFYSRPMFIYEDQEVATPKGVVTVSVKTPNEFPIVEGFCSEQDICTDTFYEWCKVHKPFSEAYKKSKAKQAKKLINHGLFGTYNASITRLLMSNCTDYREVKDVEEVKEIKVVLTDDRASKL